MEKQSDEANKTLVLKKKPEYSDSEVDRVVEQFKRDQMDETKESPAANRIASGQMEQKHTEES